MCESCGKTCCSTYAYNKMKQYTKKSNEQILSKLELIASRQTSMKPSEGKHCKLQDLRDVCPDESDDYDIRNGMVHIGEKKFISIKAIATVDIAKHGVRSTLQELVPLFWPDNYKDYSLDGKGKQITDNHIKSMIGILDSMTWKMNHRTSLEIGNVRRELSKALSHLKRPSSSNKQKPIASKEKKKKTQEVQKGKHSGAARGNDKQKSTAAEPKKSKNGLDSKMSGSSSSEESEGEGDDDDEDETSDDERD
ncbi:uncharacterized protein LOC113215076 [Frankliniella occidentalis]|uniref:Uncharacterized protein LOC113215076 n=1 Tax=Frankliniella occidentalis TaxID=133901 RepID=A0A6J1TA24_FRAOC|nr:uncharacterized protein LOC113215076 [Frankliniella occidentalis]